MSDAFYKRFLKWWNRPSAEERILEAMSFTEWRRLLEIADAADVSLGMFYVTTERLFEEGIIEKKWNNGPIPSSRAGRNFLLFRKLKSGKRRHVEQTDRSPVFNAELAT